MLLGSVNTASGTLPGGGASFPKMESTDVHTS